jgi:hypothetical protein
MVFPTICSKPSNQLASISARLHYNLLDGITKWSASLEARAPVLALHT